MCHCKQQSRNIMTACLNTLLKATLSRPSAQILRQQLTRLLNSMDTIEENRLDLE